MTVKVSKKKKLDIFLLPINCKDAEIEAVVDELLVSHREKKSKPRCSHLILVLSFLALFATVSFAEQPMTVEQVAEAKANGACVVRDGQIVSGNSNPNAQKELDFDKQFIAPNGHGGYDSTPKVAVKTVISDRMIANPDGTTEWFGNKGIDKTLQERQEQLEVIRASQKAHRDAMLAQGKASGDPDIEKSVKELEDFQNNAEKDFGWEKKDKEDKEAKAKYDAEQAEKEYKERYKVLTSY